MVKFISKNILTGLITLLPVVLTLYLLYWILISIETALGGLLRGLLPDGWYQPGMGLLAACGVAFLVGLLMHAYVVQSLFARGEQLLYRMPVIKSVYRAIRDFFDYFSPETRKEFEQVVAVRLGESEMELIGFVTQARQERLPPGLRQAGYVLVYLPLSYMIGGYAVLMPSSAVRPLDMSLEEAMRFTLTAGVTGIKPNVGTGRSKGGHKSDAGG
ncbi:DUF502 domain-containing protein [Zobellella maritima]|uniref:DUF502 domain-containing protein n=1 Tax=Zobellella maritima TaxID=2059725 RepID=UPI000E307DF0|nr:DUF502 domain-containing protein [Zobellella maritima]